MMRKSERELCEGYRKRGTFLGRSAALGNRDAMIGLAARRLSNAIGDYIIRSLLSVGTMLPPMCLAVPAEPRRD